jgi:serine acetyltransferase
MAVIANVALTNTFDTWRTRTNVGFTRLNAFAINESSLYANTLTANTSFLSKGLGTFNGRVTIGTNLNVSGNTTLGGAGKVANVQGWFGVAGRASISTNLYVAGNTTIGGSLNINGAINLGDAATDLLTVTGRAAIGTNLSVAGNTTLGSLATITTANAVFSGSTNNPLVRITQTGAGQALVVEDSTSPDSTPFVVLNDGRVVVGNTAGAFGSANFSVYNSQAATTPPAIDFAKHRAGAASQVADGLGRIRFNAFNGTSVVTAAQITVLAEATANSTSNPAYIQFATTEPGTTTPSERLRIHGRGLVNVNSSLVVNKNVTVLGNTTLNGTTTDKSNALSQTLTDGATINWDVALGRVATVTLGGNRAVAAATNQKVGTYILRVVQDGTGGRTLTWNGNYKWTAQTAPVLSTAIGAVDIITFFSDGTKMYGSYLPDMR